MADDKTIVDRNIEDSGNTTPNEKSSVEFIRATSSLPVGSALDAEGRPTYAGVNGNRLLALVTFFASCAFALFGYGTCFHRHYPHALTSYRPRCDVGAHQRSPVPRDVSRTSCRVSRDTFAVLIELQACDPAIQGPARASLLQATYVSLYEVSKIE